MVPARITELHVPMCHHRKHETTQLVQKQPRPSVLPREVGERGWAVGAGLSRLSRLPDRGLGLLFLGPEGLWLMGLETDH